ncbi:type VI secretion system Vgr family protein [Tenacibaculum maritimum]|uniref:type VI secretion system Vgr family protein n=1 Tax=Tenacibaculum maritimum TaxID=107401 RepID=UPI00387647B1
MTSENRQVSIHGEFIKGYQSIYLRQKINDHHSFTMTIDLETIENQGAYTIDKSKEWLGKTIIISVHEKDFTGIITHISLHHANGHHGQIVLSGYSSTIALENGKHLQSWLKKDLATIVQAAAKHPKITASVKPEYASPITYESQYMETHFQFLQRLAKQYHEWFYYDGDTLFFGKPEKEDAIELVYGIDIDEIQIGVQVQARKYESFSYNSFADEQYNAQSPDTPAGLNELGQLAFSASLDTYLHPTNAYSPMRIGNTSDLDTYLEKKQQSAFANANYISITSKKRGLTVGSIIDLRSEIFEKKGSFSNKRHGKYIITEITHNANVGNAYHNHIIALPADIKTLPEPNIHFPLAQTQMATVIDNEDPDGKGRVQVRMHWQTGEMKSAWIRVLTPDGGSSDMVAANRGFVFIPEIGDQVLISFRYNDPNRPFVMGSLYNGQTGAGGSSKNKIKSITTRSGSTITFDDDNEKGSILVKDGAGNTVILNGKDTVSVTANDTISLSTGNSSITLKSNGDIAIVGDNISISGSQTTSMATNDSTFNTEAGKSTVNGKKVAVSGTQTVAINGQSKATLSSSATTSIEGTIVKLN